MINKNKIDTGIGSRLCTSLKLLVSFSKWRFKGLDKLVLLEVELTHILSLARAAKELVGTIKAINALRPAEPYYSCLSQDLNEDIITTKQKFLNFQNKLAKLLGKSFYNYKNK